MPKKFDRGIALVGNTDRLSLRSVRPVLASLFLAFHASDKLSDGCCYFLAVAVVGLTTVRKDADLLPGQQNNVVPASRLDTPSKAGRPQNVFNLATKFRADRLGHGPYCSGWGMRKGLVKFAVLSTRNLR